VFCSGCGRDQTVVDGWDGDWGLSYHCDACGRAETVDLRSAGGVKLGWRVDWPMRWEREKVDFEPAGKDHHSQGGSFDTARRVSREVYGWEPPVTFRYDFIGTKGLPGKMSSSAGNVITLDDLLRVYTPELVRYLFAGTRPNTEFTISFDLDVIKIYEDYDRTERVALGLQPAKDEAEARRERRIYELSQVAGLPETPPYQAPFRHLCNLIQIADGDVDKALAGLQARPGGPTAAQAPALRARALRAKYWAEECAPEEFRFRLKPEGAPVDEALDGVERSAVRRLRDEVAARVDSFADDPSCAEAIYKVAEAEGIEGKRLFRAAYRALIGKDQGPRLASFLRSIPPERLLSILSAY